MAEISTDSQNGKTDYWARAVYLVASVFFLVPNLLYTLNSWFVRHRADDFCFSGTFREFGFLGGLAHFYSTISNRFSAFIVWSMSDMFGEKAIRFFPMLAIVFMAVAIFIVAKAFAESADLRQRISFAFLVSQLLTFFFLYLSPSIAQSVYWRAAMVHYFLPAPALIFMVLYVFKQRAPGRVKFSRLFLFFLIALFLAGLSESYAGLQGGAFALLLIYAFLPNRPGEKSHFALYAGAAIVGTLAALLIMIVSPGNSLKMATLEQAPDLLTILSISVNSSSSFIFYTIRGYWLPFCALFALGFSLSLSVGRHVGQVAGWKNYLIMFVLIPISVFFLILCISAPTAYGMMAYPEKRVLMLALIVLVVGVFCEGFLLGSMGLQFKRLPSACRFAALVIVILLSLYPLLSVASILNMKAFYQKRAVLWDLQQSEILAQIARGETDLVVTALDAHAEIAEMRDTSTFWVNLCTAQYYNVDTITAIER